ncbi:MAG: hypothetical protein U1D55_10985 [Phycisphaerae bacterium]
MTFRSTFLAAWISAALSAPALAGDWGIRVSYGGGCRDYDRVVVVDDCAPVYYAPAPRVVVYDDCYPRYYSTYRYARPAYSYSYVRPAYSYSYARPTYYRSYYRPAIRGGFYYRR